MKIIVTFCVFFLAFHSFGQEKLQISGGIDLYYGLNPMDIEQESIPIYVSSNQLNSASVNLGVIDFKYKLNDRFRFQLSPAMGTFMKANYAAENKYVRWIYESSIGISPRKRKNEWIELGIFSSPYTFENPRSWDQIAYTRAISPEFVPYYCAGVRYQNELSENYKLTLFLLNGWQKIELQKKIPSLGTQLEWRKNKEYISWTTYTGNERTDLTPDLGFRFFTEISWAHETEKFRTQACFYSGLQHIKNDGLKNWWQINGIFDYKFGKKTDAYIRQEYYHDPNKIQIATPINAIGFTGFVSSLGLTHRLSDNLIFRVEGKSLFSSKENQLFTIKGSESSLLPLIFANITVLF
jgi:hypothetical protein